MRKAAWIPSLSFGTCLVAMLAVGVRAQAAAPCIGPGPLDEAGAPGVTGWGGPPSVDGSLDDGAPPGYGDGGLDVLDMLGVRPAGTLPQPFVYTTVTAPYTDLAGCMAYDAQGHQAAHDCLCQNCLPLMEQCDALTGCRAQWKCGEDSGCAGNTSVCTVIDSLYPALGCSLATTCYFAPGAACATLIDTWGNSGVPTATDFNLANCGSAHSCPNQ